MSALLPHLYRYGSAGIAGEASVAAARDLLGKVTASSAALAEALATMDEAKLGTAVTGAEALG